MLECTLLFLVGLAGGILPLFARWTHRQLHAALALSTGIFLGAVFLHLLPEVQAAGGHGGHDHGGGHGHGHAGGPWLFVLAGAVGFYLLEALVLRTADHDELHRHRSVGWAALFGLVVHALTAGLALAAAGGDGAGLASPMMIAVLGHKGFETFSLTSVFRLAEAGRARSATLLVLFSLVTPAGFLIGSGFSSALGAPGAEALGAVATGVFLCVCLSELLPEVFHHREDGGWKTLLLVAGVVAMAALHGLEG